jgi:hypothetical protein
MVLCWQGTHSSTQTKKPFPVTPKEIVNFDIAYFQGIGAVVGGAVMGLGAGIGGMAQAIAILFLSACMVLSAALVAGKVRVVLGSFVLVCCWAAALAHRRAPRLIKVAYTACGMWSFWFFSTNCIDDITLVAALSILVGFLGVAGPAKSVEQSTNSSQPNTIKKYLVIAELFGAETIYHGDSEEEARRSMKWHYFNCRLYSYDTNSGQYAYSGYGWTAIRSLFSDVPVRTMDSAARCISLRPDRGTFLGENCFDDKKAK